MGQRLQKLNLDFSGFSRGASRLVEAAQIAAQGKAALGAGIASGIDKISGSIARNKENAREDARRSEAYAREDRIRSEGYARADALRVQERAARLADEQRRMDEANILKTEKRIEEIRQQVSGASMFAVGPDGAPDPAVATAIQSLTDEMRRHQSTLSVLQGRAVGAMPPPPPPPTPDQMLGGQAVARLRARNGQASGSSTGSNTTPRRGGSMDAAATAVSDSAFAGGPGFFPAKGGGAPTVDPLADALTKAEGLRQQVKMLNAEAAKAHNDTIRNALYGQATLIAMQAKAEEVRAEGMSEQQKAQAAERKAAAEIAKKKADDEAAQKKKDANATAEYEAETGDRLGAVVPEGYAKGRLQKYRDERERDQATFAKRAAQDAEDEKRREARRSAQVSADATAGNRAAENDEQTIEREINDAEQDRSSAVSRLNAVVGAMPPDPDEIQKAKNDVALAEKAVRDARARRRTARGGAPASSAASAGIGPETGRSAIRDWIRGGND